MAPEELAESDDNRDVFEVLIKEMSRDAQVVGQVATAPQICGQSELVEASKQSFEPVMMKMVVSSYQLDVCLVGAS